MQLIDTHAHLDDDRFDDIRDEVVARATEAGIAKIICIGTTSKTSLKCVEIAERYPTVYAAVGIQPNYAGEQTEDDWELVAGLVGRPKVVAIGETGLDYYWDEVSPEIQEPFLRRHLELARQHDLPFVIHMREPKDGQSTPCCEHLLRVMRETSNGNPLKGVMHSYTGNAAFAESFLDLGLMISFAGMVTYKSAADIREVAKLVPADRLLIETDSPYLSPHPKRGQRPNEPALVRLTAECVADVRGLELPQLAEITTTNAVKLFNFSKQ